MEQQDIRWKQRFQNFDKAFLRLSKAMQIIRKEPDNFLLQAFQSGYIQEGDLWLQALNDRNLTTHTYDEETALSVANNIQTSYFPLLKSIAYMVGNTSTRLGLISRHRKLSTGLFPISACRGSDRIRFEGQRQP